MDEFIAKLEMIERYVDELELKIERMQDARTREINEIKGMNTHLPLPIDINSRRQVK